MEYVIGIDSGGTNYRVMACDLTGKCLGSYTGVPANHYYIELPEMMRRINLAIDSCLAEFGGARSEIRAFVCGTTGLDSEEDGILLHDLYTSIPGISCPVRVINDAELAHYTVTGGKGVLVISGTGSIGYGRSRSGQTARAGGWLFSILGDEGSGTWVSKSALRQLGRWLDGACESGPMVTMLSEELQITKRSDLNRLALSMGTPPWRTPELGRMVNRAATQGDAEALRILQEAAAKIFGIVQDVAGALHLPENEPNFPIGVWGSNIVESPLVLEAFRALATETYPQSRIQLPQRSATQGAAAMALEMLV